MEGLIERKETFHEFLSQSIQIFTIFHFNQLIYYENNECFARTSRLSHLLAISEAGTEMKINRNPMRTKIRSIESAVVSSAGGVVAQSYKLQITDSPEFGQAGYLYQDFKVNGIQITLIPYDPNEMGFAVCYGAWTEDDTPIAAGSSFDTVIEEADPPATFDVANRMIRLKESFPDNDFRDIADEQSGSSKVGTYDFFVYGKGLSSLSTQVFLVVVTWDVTFR
jgi:hypothetical protein